MNVFAFVSSLTLLIRAIAGGSDVFPPEQQWPDSTTPSANLAPKPTLENTQCDTLCFGF